MVMILKEILFLQALENAKFSPDLKQSMPPCMSNTPLLRGLKHVWCVHVIKCTRCQSCKNFFTRDNCFSI